MNSVQPGCDMHATDPPIASVIDLTIERPRPGPPMGSNRFCIRLSKPLKQPCPEIFGHARALVGDRDPRPAICLGERIERDGAGGRRKLQGIGDQVAQ